jgi:hypothetical protein
MNGFSQRLKAIQVENEISTKSSALEASELSSVTEKIKRFFNNDNTKFCQDLSAFDIDNETIKLSDVFAYLHFKGIPLAPAEERVLINQFRVGRNDRVVVDNIASLIFFGTISKSKKTLHHRSLNEKMFIDETREEINILSNSTAQLFEEFDRKNNDRLVTKEEFVSRCASKSFGLSPQELEEIFVCISSQDGGNGVSFNLKDFRHYIFGMELQDIRSHIVKIDESLRIKNKEVRDFFFSNNRSVQFDEFRRQMLSLDPTMSCIDIDLIFSNLDNDCSGNLSMQELLEKFESHRVLVEFKEFLIKHAEKRNGKVKDVLYMLHQRDNMNQEEFRKFIGEITSSKSLVTQIRWKATKSTSCFNSSIKMEAKPFPNLKSLMFLIWPRTKFLWIGKCTSSALTS